MSGHGPKTSPSPNAETRELPGTTSVRERLRKLTGGEPTVAPSDSSACGAKTQAKSADPDERASGARSEALVLVAGADPTCWSRVRDGLQGRYAVAFAPDLPGTLDVLRQHRPAVFLLWSRLLDANVESSTRCLRCACRNTAVIAITDGAQQESSVLERLRVDAYLTEREVEASLLSVVQRLLEQRSQPGGPLSLSRGDLSEHPERALESLPAFRHLVIGRSRAFHRVLETAYRVAPTDVTVLIQGESGTGKELMARWVHCMSPRARAPFESADLPAIPDELFESIFFGHERGAFTGAVAPNQGKFQKAEGGTLFLDEVSNLKLHLQPKLLRVLQEREVESVGGRDRASCNVRVVAATNVDLEQAVQRGEFRADLFYRLNVVTLRLPPLRERSEDIPDLIDFLVQKYATRFNRTPPTVGADALEALRTHLWPGNIRELENRVQTAVLLGGDTLGSSAFFREHEAAVRASASVHFCDTESSLEDIQRLYVRWVLDRNDGNQSQAAQILRIDRKTLRAKLQRRENRSPRGSLDLVASRA